MKRILATLVLLILAQATYALPLAQTTATALNVRIAPEGSVVVSLPRYTVVGVVETQGDWTKIMYFPGSDPAPAKHGWVSTYYLRAIKPSNKRTEAQPALPADEMPITNDTASAN
ncbi:hypothetical protein [Halioxenophilus aromaticivorans]|uniref:hypothetical protein n=1 Tax=Halioxenophilus aromaticivorans TaxID=1306992 RepID=UPI0031E5846D